jgi:hypothetical protein
MPSEQERRERVARNESLFRDVNERMDRQTPEPSQEAVAFFCECGDSACTELVRLSTEAYESVRAHSNRFFMVPGHQLPDTEDVVAEGAGYLVARKHENVRHVVEKTDPRS